MRNTLLTSVFAASLAAGIALCAVQDKSSAKLGSTHPTTNEVSGILTSNDGIVLQHNIGVARREWKQVVAAALVHQYMTTVPRSIVPINQAKELMLSEKFDDTGSLLLMSRIWSALGRSRQAVECIDRMTELGEARADLLAFKAKEEIKMAGLREVLVRGNGSQIDVIPGTVTPTTQDSLNRKMILDDARSVIARGFQLEPENAEILFANAQMQYLIDGKKAEATESMDSAIRHLGDGWTEKIELDRMERFRAALKGVGYVGLQEEAMARAKLIFGRGRPQVAAKDVLMLISEIQRDGVKVSKFDFVDDNGGAEARIILESPVKRDPAVLKVVQDRLNKYADTRPATEPAATRPIPESTIFSNLIGAPIPMLKRDVSSDKEIFIDLVPRSSSTWNPGTSADVGFLSTAEENENVRKALDQIASFEEAQNLSARLQAMNAARMEIRIADEQMPLLAISQTCVELEIKDQRLLDAWSNVRQVTGGEPTGLIMKRLNVIPGDGDHVTLSASWIFLHRRDDYGISGVR